MSDILPEIPEEVAVEKESEVNAFKEAVAKADGALLPLRKTTKDGKKLFISARHLKNPEDEPHEDVNPKFYGWEDSRKEARMSGVLLIDLYTEQDEKIVPVGHMDWYSLHKTYANGGGNLHEAALPKSEHESLAKAKWEADYDPAFEVDRNHQEKGLGSLLLATSAVVLSKIGVTDFFPGALLEPAQKTYARFGLKLEDFEGFAYDRHLPIETLSLNPQVNKAIAAFV